MFSCLCCVTTALLLNSLLLLLQGALMAKKLLGSIHWFCLRLALASSCPQIKPNQTRPTWRKKVKIFEGQKELTRHVSIQFLVMVQETQSDVNRRPYLLGFFFFLLFLFVLDTHFPTICILCWLVGWASKHPMHQRIVRLIIW